MEKSRKKQLLSKLRIVIPTVVITVICMLGIMRFAWANEFTHTGITEITALPVTTNETAIMSEELGTKVIAQICILVHDIEKTAKVYGDFFGLRYRINESEAQNVAQTMYNGQPTPARCKMAFFQLGDIQLELIQPDEHPSVWREDLDKNGEGFHHIGFFVKGTDDVLKKLESIGMHTRMTGSWGTGCYAYVDAFDQLKFLLETLENY